MRAPISKIGVAVFVALIADRIFTIPKMTDPIRYLPYPLKDVSAFGGYFIVAYALFSYGAKLHHDSLVRRANAIKENLAAIPLPNG